MTFSSDRIGKVCWWEQEPWKLKRKGKPAFCSKSSQLLFKEKTTAMQRNWKDLAAFCLLLIFFF